MWSTGSSPFSTSQSCDMGWRRQKPYFTADIFISIWFLCPIHHEQIKKVLLSFEIQIRKTKDLEGRDDGVMKGKKEPRKERI